MTRALAILLALTAAAAATDLPVVQTVTLPAWVPNTGAVNLWTQAQDTWTNPTSATTGTTWTPTGWQSSYEITLTAGAFTIAAPANVRGQTTFYSFTIVEPAAGTATVTWAKPFYAWAGGTPPTFANGPGARSEVVCKLITAPPADCNLAGANYK